MSRFQNGRGGRGRGGRGRGGRSGGRGNHSHKSTNTNNKTNTKDQAGKRSTKLDNPINHYKSGTGTANLTNTMEVHEVIMSHIQKTFVEGYDVAWALKYREDFDFIKIIPAALEELSAEDKKDATKVAEYNLQKTIKDTEVSQWTKRQNTYRNNMNKSFSIILNQCEDTLKRLIEQQSDYDAKIHNKPIALLDMIDKLAQNRDDSKYDMAITVDSLKSLVNIRQSTDEDIGRYRARVSTAMRTCHRTYTRAQFSKRHND
mmetsp:Transcript_46070/g.112508  ORF Transcript_46070/g.112508 Transcript_46070/m.112508 type:complete len:259 (-) Transcript_46070:139-915(-)